ncbi:HET-domain-containing protein [Dothidotthia symphoricarpi CBS 119687]|uniref:HET-domain-containing protein n=1 Tax=Dothidotthia symphoricarpi CBS 119687 TaxID=1392245 RepID=A0A6A6A3W5_9PLEO|nr:HET-domain-containing protein [Dothidotthia symphoricarpi CBS 119687]KAF2126702.1 HET-domain-containing protein [Dothidotthia symphoricarpi CBS 119687]
MSNRREDVLCRLCLQALILDDARAGGFVNVSSSHPTLNLSRFKADDWTTFSSLGKSYEYCLRRPEDTDVPNLVASMGLERTATLPNLDELSSQSVGNTQTCVFCQALKKSFIKRYQDTSWWREEGSLLRYSIRYEWESLSAWWREEGSLLQHFIRYEWESRSKESEEPEYSLEGVTVITWHPGLEFDRAGLFYFPVAADFGRCRDWLNIRRSPFDVRGPLSSGNVTRMKNWLGDCLKNHVSCKTPVDSSKPSFIPTRLLDLGPEPADNHVVLLDDVESRLETESKLDLKYAALSYCWGSAVPFTTTSETIGARQAIISVNDLPIVFQEAILVARKLGLRYLWIDALCIIQDDLADWERESSQMSYVFAYAHVTIGAAASAACDASFLRRSSKPNITIPFKSMLSPDVRGGYTLYLESDEQIRVDYESSRWNSRAWVYQEKKLATRLLIFGETMLQMQCRELALMESGIQSPYGQQAGVLDHFDRHLWNIDEYSSKNLTYRGDRLSAVSGVARLISKAAREIGQPVEYLAGLWHDTSSTESDPIYPYTNALGGSLMEQLCWDAFEPADTFEHMIASLTATETYCAPSWSWASRDCSVNHRFPSIFKQQFQLLRWNLPPLRSDAMVAVKPGSSITLRGVMRRLSLPPLNTSYDGSTKNQEDDRYSRIFWPRECFGGGISCTFDWKLDGESSRKEDIRKRLKTFDIGRDDGMYGLVLFSETDDAEDEASFCKAVDAQCVGEVPKDGIPQRTETVYTLRQPYLRVGLFMRQSGGEAVDCGTEVEVTII